MSEIGKKILNNNDQFEENADFGHFRPFFANNGSKWPKIDSKSYKICKLIVFYVNDSLWWGLNPEISDFQILTNFALFSSKIRPLLGTLHTFHSHLNNSKWFQRSKSTCMQLFSSIWEFLTSLYPFFKILVGRVVGPVCKLTAKFGSKTSNIM